MRLKVGLLIILPLIISSLISGCGDDESKRVETINVGTIRYMNVTEDALNKFHEQQPESAYTQPKYKYVFFDNMPSVISALQSGQIEEFSTYETVADYLVMNDTKFERTPGEYVMIDLFCCAMRENDAELKREFDAAINAMRADGTFTSLVKEYISNINHSIIPPSVAMPAIYDAKTIKVGVTGDLPRLDYVRADGTPAGFNTAVLAEISERIGKNFELMQIDSGARAVALLSGVVDVIFWAAVSGDKTGVPEDFDRPAGMIFTEPYFSDRIVHVRPKK